MITSNTLILAGWAGICTAFITGMLIGLFVPNEKWLGGYGSPSRRYVRLGHIACAALGMINILVGLTLHAGFSLPEYTGPLFLTGLISMPLVCWITALHPKGFFLFPIPAISLFVAALSTFTTLAQMGGN